MDPQPSHPRVPLPTTEPAPAAAPAPPTAEDASAAQPALDPAQVQEIEEGVMAALRTCYDPEIPVNIVELGLIYGVEVSPTGAVAIRMTLTSPACPAAVSLPPEVQEKAQTVPHVRSVKVDVVWDPPWDKDRMSEAARLELGIFD